MGGCVLKTRAYTFQFGKDSQPGLQDLELRSVLLLSDTIHYLPPAFAIRLKNSSPIIEPAWL